MLFGKLLTTVISLFLGVSLVSARQTLIAKYINGGEIMLSAAAVEPFWSTGMELFRKSGNYARVCLLLVILTSWSFLSGFLLPIGVTRPTVCPYTATNGQVSKMSYNAFSYAGSTARLSSWFNYYSSGVIPANSLLSATPNTPSWVFVPEMNAGNFSCNFVTTPLPNVKGFIVPNSNGIYQVGYDASSLVPSWTNTVTGGSWTNTSSIISGYDYSYLAGAVVNNVQLLNWTNAIGFASYSTPQKPNQLEILMVFLGSRNQVPLLPFGAAGANQSFVFDRNQGITCQVQWVNQTSNVQIQNAAQAAAIEGDTFYGTYLDAPLNLTIAQQLTASIIASQFDIATAGTPGTYGREISCLTVSDGISVYYAVGIILFLGATIITLGGSGIKGKEGALRRSDIPITGLGWVHFVNNIYNSQWKIGAKENKEVYLVPPQNLEELDAEAKMQKFPKRITIRGNHAAVLDSSALTLDGDVLNEKNIEEVSMNEMNAIMQRALDKLQSSQVEYQEKYGVYQKRLVIEDQRAVVARQQQQEAEMRAAQQQQEVDMQAAQAAASAAAPAAYSSGQGQQEQQAMSEAPVIVALHPQ